MRARHNVTRAKNGYWVTTVFYEDGSCRESVGRYLDWHSACRHANDLPSVKDIQHGGRFMDFDVQVDSA